MPSRHSGSPREVLALDAFVKLARAATTVTGRLNQRLQQDHDLTESQLGVLEALFHLGPMPQSELCRKILRSGSNVTTVVDNLERAGLVRRAAQDDDRRVRVVQLTTEGRRVIERVFPLHAGRVTELMGTLTRDEQRELGRLCRKLGLATAAADPED
ncbi:MAG: MarR family transcriptional regulator [Gemmatimonadaceae bacterium]|nr:MarR family transcriptional regulator [Gemmatimonadaceae bacterium]NUQ91322.1 MarR family transcriptional regulator [Gemmatimonadaceae bacterium]NUR20129.1 MarR family transcriptional regulator [Gemmatimonadaceae bacterium]NUS96335.1 MarR family transcriptional regulator [Gemmatimonadaceae bacterium]